MERMLRGYRKTSVCPLMNQSTSSSNNNNDPDTSIRSVASIAHEQNKMNLGRQQQQQQGSPSFTSNLTKLSRDLSVASRESTAATTESTASPGVIIAEDAVVETSSTMNSEDTNSPLKCPEYRCEPSVSVTQATTSNAADQTPASSSTPPEHAQHLNQHSSTLSFSDMYDDGDTTTTSTVLSPGLLASSLEKSTKQPQQQNSLDTPPASMSVTPPSGDFMNHATTDVIKIALPPAMLQLQHQHQQQPKPQPPPTATATAAESHTDNNTICSSAESSVASRRAQRRPVLYSAIGSLEDPTTNSLSRYGTTKREKKFEFPSTRLLPPPDTVKPKPKSLLGGEVPLYATDNKATTETSTLGDSAVSASVAADSIIAPTSKPLTTLNSGANKKPKPSNLRRKKKEPSITTESSRKKSDKKVTIAADAADRPTRGRSAKKNKGGGRPIEMFRPSSDAYTPRMGKKVIKYKPAEQRTPVQKMASPLGTLSRPNFSDALRRVAMIIHQHVIKIEGRFENKKIDNKGLFRESMRDEFSEERFVTPTYKCTMVRVPMMARPGMVYGLKRVRAKYEIPSVKEIYEFGHQLFKKVQLSSECSIVCLIYVERLMEAAKVPLMAETWRPIFMCGLLLASKVWQDLSSWNIEFATVYPQYPLESINRLEALFLRMVKWDLYISSSSYAKYYFALRALVEKSDFRQRYNRMVGGVDNVQASEALKIEQRSSMVKEEALVQLSRSME